MTAGESRPGDSQRDDLGPLPSGCGLEVPGVLGGRLAISRLLIVFAVALVLRAGYGGLQLVKADDPTALTFPDEQQYWMMAQALRDGQLLTDELGFHATRMPLYPAFLSLFARGSSGVIAAKVCHWVIGAIGAVLAALLGARVAGPAVGFVAGLIVAADLSLVGTSSLLLTETPYVTVVTALWLVAWPVGEQAAGIRRWLAVGFLAALCVYVRPSAAGLIVVWIAFQWLRRRDKLALAGAAVALGIVIVSLIPWAMRNHRVTGHWCWLTHRLGISLYDGVGPQATGAGDLGDIKAMPAVAGLDEVAWNEWFLDASWEAMRDDPGRICRLAGVKLARTWSPILHAQEYGSTAIRVIFAVWSLPLFALVVVGIILMLRSRRAIACLGLLLPALYLSALHCLFVGSIRYRVGAIPMLAVLAAVAAVALWNRVGARHGEPA